MRIAICDDEPQVTDRISWLLQLYFKEEYTIDIFHSGIKLKDNFTRFRIIFLDIDIGDANGIELAKLIRAADKQVFIVFITNYAEYARHAFSVHAFDYIIKPISQKKMFHVLDEIKSYGEEDRQMKYVSLKGKDGIGRFRVNQINYFEYSERRVKAVLDGETLWMTCSLSEVEHLFEEYDFTMPHRAFVVNQHKIRAVKNHDIVMENGDIVPIAQKKAHTFKKEFESYLYNQL